MANAQAMATRTTIAQLPVQLLARILAVLQPAERLGSAALVATAWCTAAVLGTHEVHMEIDKLSKALPKRLEILSAWLTTHSYAGIAELYVTMPHIDVDIHETPATLPVLLLPSLQRLPGLECLHCYGLTVTAAQANSEAEAQPAEAPAAADAAPAAPLLPLELSPATALTHLQLYSCDVTVQGLAALTRLQGLTLGGHLELNLPDAVTTNFSTELQQALPQLQALRFLRLFGKVAHDDILQHVSSLPRLQDLTLVDGMLTLASFQQLPQSLTQLSIEWAASNTTSRKLSVSSAPGVCALTGLQELTVRAGGVSMEVLANMTLMKRLDLQQAELDRPGTLSVLTALTQLTYMSLPLIDADVVMLSNADAAAVRASAQLVELDLSESGLMPYRGQHIFAANRQLTKLTKLHVSLDLVHDGRSASRVASCCPNLVSIYLGPNKEDDWVAPDDDFVSSDLASMLVRWQPLQHLTSLTLEVQDLPMLPDVWHALARLTQLQELKVSTNKLEYLAGVLNLTSCTRLKSLLVDANSMEGMMDRVWLDVTGEEAADGTTTLAQQLPKALQQSILQQVSEDNGTPELLSVLVRCAADVQLAQEQQLAQQQGEIAQLRRELRGVQASLAAVLQQLQGQAGPGRV